MALVTDEEAIRALLMEAADLKDPNREKNKEQQAQYNRNSSSNGGKRSHSNLRSQHSRDDHRHKRSKHQSGYERRNNHNNKYHSNRNNGKMSKYQRQEKVNSESSGAPHWGTKEQAATEAAEATDADKPQLKANFNLTGLLAQDKKTGNTRNGVVLKFTAPRDARPPPERKGDGWLLYIYEGEKMVDKYSFPIYGRDEQNKPVKLPHILFGSNSKVADIVTLPGITASQHAVIVFRIVQAKKSDPDVLPDHGKHTGPYAGRSAVDSHVPGYNSEALAKYYAIRPYVVDLGSPNGTKLNGEVIEERRMYQILPRDAIQFGDSKRKYIMLHKTLQ
eukprot:g3754.t1